MTSVDDEGSGIIYQEMPAETLWEMVRFQLGPTSGLDKMTIRHQDHQEQIRR
jgi:hypothetical protein